MGEATPALSLVIPCYNEAGNLPRLVARCREVFPSPEFEVVFVDNGSTDGSARLFEELLAGFDAARVVRVPVNRGYGHGIVTGLHAAQGRFLAWTHADLQTDPADARRGLALFEAAADPDRLFVKGIRRGRPLRDVLFTWGMAAFEAVVLGGRGRLRDINAQPTMFSRRFFESLDAVPDDFSLDLCVYYEAVRRGLTVQRFPVHFGARMAGIGHNETLRAKLRYSWRTVRYSLALRRRLRRLR